MSMPVVFMDETGNKETDRFFICGFMEVADVNEFHRQLQRIRDQIKGLADRNRKQRVLNLKTDGDIEQLFQFAYRLSSFELKFDKITKENLSLFQDLLRLLARKVEFKFTAIVIDRQDPSYEHRTLIDMYKLITHKFFNYRMKNKVIFMPDEFDTGMSWSNIVRSDNIAAVVPLESHSSLALQCCDVLGGVIGLGLKDKSDYTKRDDVRLSMVAVFEQELNCQIKQVFTVSKPRYISVWTLDFAKAGRK